MKKTKKTSKTNHPPIVENYMNSDRYQLSFHAQELPNKKWFGVSSPYVTVKITSGPQKGQFVGETEPVYNTLDPDWVKILPITFKPSEVTNLEVTIWDNRGVGKEPLWLGEANFETTSLSRGRKYKIAADWKKRKEQVRTYTHSSCRIICRLLSWHHVGLVLTSFSLYPNE
jgi:hypothetical protein